MRFTGKVVLVTGGAKGIGRAAVEAFSAEGAAVVIADVDAPKGEALAQSLPKAVFAKTDVTQMREAERAVQIAVEKFQGLDVLFSNAGIQVYDRIEEVTEEAYERGMGVNFKGHVWMCKYAIPQLRRRGGGAIVCTSSVQGLATQTNVPLYAASKAATINLVKALSMDHAHEGLRVNAILPGSVDTPLLRANAALATPDDPDASIRKWGEMHPIGRVIQPEEVARLVLFLCSDEARAITGAAYLIDGGLMAKLPVVLGD